LSVLITVRDLLGPDDRSERGDQDAALANFDDERVFGEPAVLSPLVSRLVGYPEQDVDIT
jgi:hypothetical protein